ncbi:MAG: hypothetical protein P8Z00_19985 [Anaerolineales bacterium]
MSYRVLVDDNFHYLDETERYELGSFEDLESAIRAAKKVVDSFLASEYQPGITARQLFKYYLTFGEDPFILAPDQSKAPFSAWEYAQTRCDELCNLK